MAVRPVCAVTTKAVISLFHNPNMIAMGQEIRQLASDVSDSHCKGAEQKAQKMAHRSKQEET